MLDVSKDDFSSEAEALAKIAEMGWNPLVRDTVLAEDEPLHWHDFESVVFIISGTMRLADEEGAVTEVNAGSWFQGKPRRLHRELAGSNYRVVFGFKNKLSEFTMPINKDPALLSLG